MRFYFYVKGQSINVLAATRGGRVVLAYSKFGVFSKGTGEMGAAHTCGGNRLAGNSCRWWEELFSGFGRGKGQA